MKHIINSCLVVLVLSSTITLAQKPLQINGKIDPKMNNKEIRMYHILPSFSSLMPAREYVDTIKDGKFSFNTTISGFELFGFQITHQKNIYNAVINVLPGGVKIEFLDTLLRTFKVNGSVINDEVDSAFSRIRTAKGDTTTQINILKEYAGRPFFTYLLFSLANIIPEQQIVKMYNSVPDINKQNSWSIDLNLAIAKFLVGKQAPGFTQQNIDGKNIKLSDYRGKYVLLDFWASWCIPCRKENPNMVKAYAAYKSKGFEILSVSLDSEKKDWIEAVNKDNLSWQHVSDLKGWQNAVSKGIYKVRSVPQNYLIDPNGVVIAKDLFGNNLFKFLGDAFK